MSESSPLKISIAMATYNGAAYLQEQLDSFLAQTRLPDELVITDDCSTDGTLEIIERFAASAPFEVHWEQNEQNLGCTGNFNKALMKTTGDLVFLSDQDDVWLAQKTENFIATYQSTPSAFAITCDCFITDENLHTKKTTKLAHHRALNRDLTSFITGCCSCLTRPFLNNVLPIPNDQPEHDTFLIGLAAILDRRVLVEEPLLLYRRHSTNTSGGIAKTPGRTRPMLRALAIANKYTNWHYPDLNRQIKRLSNIERYAANLAHEGMAHNEEHFFRRLDLVRGKLRAATNRRAVLQRNRLQRLPYITRMLREGDYSAYSGFLSAVKDLFR